MAKRIISHGAVLCLMLCFGVAEADQEKVAGIVFHEVDGSGVFDPERDKPLGKVAASNGRDDWWTYEGRRIILV